MGVPYYPNITTGRGSTLSISPGIGGTPYYQPPTPVASTPITPTIAPAITPAQHALQDTTLSKSPSYWGDNLSNYMDVQNSILGSSSFFNNYMKQMSTPVATSSPGLKYDPTAPVDTGTGRVPYPGYQGVPNPGVPGIAPNTTWNTLDTSVNLAPIAAQWRDMSAAALQNQYGQVQGEINAIPGMYAPIQQNVMGELNQLQSANSPFKQISQAVAGDISGLQGDISGLKGQIQGDINTLRSQINPFVEATVRPLEQQLVETQAQATRDFARRGVFGTLSEQGVQNATLPLRQEIARQKTLATQSALGEIEKRQGLLGDLTLGSNQQVTQMRSLMGQLATDQYQTTLGKQQLLTQIQGNALEATLARQGLLTDITKTMANLSQQELTSEMGALGLAQSSIDQVLKSMYPGGSSTSGTTTASQPNTGSNLGGFLFGIGSMLSAFA